MYVHDQVNKHVYIEYAMLVDLNAHTGTRSSTLQTVTQIHAGEYYSDICEAHTHTHNKLNNYDVLIIMCIIKA